MKYILTTLLLLILLAAGTAQAQNTPLPDLGLGIWSTPDCTNANKVIVLSRHYQLNISKTRHNMTSIKDVRAEDYDGDMLYFMLTGDSRGYFFKITNDGLMEYLPYFVHPAQPLIKAWDLTLTKLASEYTRCTKLFPGTPMVTQEDVNIPFLLDQVHEFCGGVDPDHFPKAVSCHDALFALADTDSNKTLNNDELMRIYRQLRFLEESLPATCRPAEPQSSTPAANMTDAAARFAQEALLAGDTGKDGSLNREEAIHLFTNPLTQSFIAPVMKTLRASRFAFHFLPLSDAEKSCNSTTGPTTDEPYTGVIVMPVPSPLNLDPAGGGCGCGGS